MERSATPAQKTSLILSDRYKLTSPLIIREPLKMPSVAFLETETKKCDFSFPSFSSTYVLKNGSIS
ncbi:MAG: hypothetical protein OXE03_08745, partial [Gammaproteobacteria bacterium]|nr:hypothetical protein [Gammaproteobacteria bacterium]